MAESSWDRRIRLRRRAMLRDRGTLRQFIVDETPVWRIAEQCASSRPEVRRAFAREDMRTIAPVRRVWFASGWVSVALSLLACEADYRKDMDDGFPTPIGFGLDTEEDLRLILIGAYHAQPDDAECVARTIFETAVPDPQAGAKYSITEEQLDAAADVCQMDFSDMWFTYD